MASESQVVLDMDAPQVMLVHEAKAKSASGIWRTCGVLLTVALCATAAAICFTQNKHTQNGPDETQASEIKHALRQISETAKAAIHLSGSYDSQFSNTSIKWSDNTDQSFASGLKMENNEIRIPHNGLYFVYSQAAYKLKCKDDEDVGNMMHISHTVERSSDSYGKKYKPLLSTIRSACKKTAEGNSWFGAVYLGAVFNLEAGDRLRTKTDLKLLPSVERSGGKTFFGAFSL